MPAGAVGISLLLGSTAPGDANQPPSGSRTCRFGAFQCLRAARLLFVMRSPMLPGRRRRRATANSSSPGEIGGATADGEVPGGVTADGATGATVGATGVGTTGGVIGELSVERSGLARLRKFDRGEPPCYRRAGAIDARAICLALARSMLDEGGGLMSLRHKYVKILSAILPAGAVGVSLLLGSTARALTSIHQRCNLWPPIGVASPKGWPQFVRRSRR